MFLLTANSTLKKTKRHLRQPLIFPIFGFLVIGSQRWRSEVVWMKHSVCVCVMMCSSVHRDKVPAEWTWVGVNTELHHTELIWTLESTKEHTWCTQRGNFHFLRVLHIELRTHWKLNGNFKKESCNYLNGFKKKCFFQILGIQFSTRRNFYKESKRVIYKNIV